MSERQTVLMIDDDPIITSALAATLAAAGRTIIVCSDVESAALALDRYAVTDLVTDVQFSGTFGFEGLHFLERTRRKLPRGRIVVMTGDQSDALRGALVAYGVSAMLAKPFETSELEAILGTPGGRESFELVEIPTVDTIIGERLLYTEFQPIVATRDAQPVAFEALARVRGGWPGGGAAALFEYAAKRSRAVELNRAALVNAIEAAAALPPSSLVFINVDPPTFSDRRLVDDITRTAASAGLPSGRLVLEVTERVPLHVDDISRRAFETLHAAGVRFALDDHGSAYSHLTTIASIRPSFIKISGIFGTGFEDDVDKQRVIRNVLSLSRDFGCETVLEGVETRPTAEATRELGIDLAQGYFFGVPREVSHWMVAA